MKNQSKRDSDEFAGEIAMDQQPVAA